MRENMGLHRGKRLDTGEWVEGSFLRDGESHRFADREDLPFSDCYIVPKTEYDNVRTYLTQGILLNVIAYHVIPDSVGRFTGLEDKNGKRIFENDTVRFKRKFVHGGAVVRIGRIVYDERNARFHISDSDGYICWDFYEVEDIEVAHDNPELLEVTPND